MADWKPPTELNQPVPRAIKMAKGYKIFILLLSTAIFIPFGIINFCSYEDYYKSEALKERGISINGTIFNLYSALSQGRNPRMEYFVDYRFIPTEPPDNQPSGFQGEDTVPINNFQGLQIGQTVPIVYDPLKPDRSAINYDDNIHTANPFGIFCAVDGFVGIVTCIIYGVIMPFIFLQYFKEKKLLKWGTTAAATIIDEKEIKEGKTRATAVTYEFKDVESRIIQGVRKDLPTKAGLEKEEGRKSRAAIMDNPTVLFDPRNSAKNLLYPPVSVKLGRSVR